jgi:hypothetical protein
MQGVRGVACRSTPFTLAISTQKNARSEWSAASNARRQYCQLWLFASSSRFTGMCLSVSRSLNTLVG